MKIQLFLSLILWPCLSFSQEEKPPKIGFMEAGLFVHSISLPLQASNGLLAFNRIPGFQVGIGKGIWRQRGRLQTQLLLKLAAYHQPKLHYGYELSSALLGQYRIGQHWQGEGDISIGYLHTFEDAPLYSINTLEQIRDWGRAQGVVSSSLGISRMLNKRLSFFTHYRFTFQLPFARRAGVFFIPHSRIAMGIRFNTAS